MPWGKDRASGIPEPGRCGGPLHVDHAHAAWAAGGTPSAGQTGEAVSDQYRPGDVVNGHRLNDQGTAWEPLFGAHAMPPERPRWSRRRTVAVALLATPVVMFTGFVGVGAALLASGYEPVEDPVSAASSPTPPPEPVDSDGDGVTDDEDAYPTEPSRSSLADRDGDGVANETDVAPDDPAVSAYQTGTVTRVVDGDTVEVSGAGTIRVIGIDTAEQGECGYEEASAALSSLVLGRQVTLVPGARDDRDTYDRLLRYLDAAGVDAGRTQVAAGLAIARYDSRDGYGAHPREADYVAVDARTPARVTCTAPAPPPPAPAPATQPAPAPLTQPAPAPAPSAEPWNAPGPDLDCADIGHPVVITGPDYHRLDRNGDGIGCESS